MRQDIERFLADWVQSNRPQERKSDTQKLLEQIVQTITYLRRHGYSWAQLAKMLDDAGVTDQHGQPMKPGTLRRKAVRAGYPTSSGEEVEAVPVVTEPDAPSARVVEGKGRTAFATPRPRPTETNPQADKGSLGDVFAEAQRKRRPPRLEDLNPYSTEDITQDATQSVTKSKGGK